MKQPPYFIGEALSISLRGFHAHKNQHKKKKAFILKILALLVILAISMTALKLFHRPGSAEDYVSDYITDKKRQITLKDTELGNGPGEHFEKTESELKDYIAGSLVNRGTAEYFRFLQTRFNQGRTFQENTDLIHRHLLSILPPENGEELFELYMKYLNFEYLAAEKAKDWDMPESVDETLELISKMKGFQEDYFGEETADLLFGADMKVMEYNARRSGIINDSYATGIEKEKLLERLDYDMFGVDSSELEKTKNPYNLFEEKLLVYKNDLDVMEPYEKETMIRGFREKYLPKEKGQAN
jgi:hypothetical protein